MKTFSVFGLMSVLAGVPAAAQDAVPVAAPAPTEEPGAAPTAPPAAAPAAPSAPSAPSARSPAEPTSWAEAETYVRFNIPWTEPSGTGVGISYLHGSWGGEWAQELRVSVPLFWAIGAQLRGVYLGIAENDLYRGEVAGRLEFTGRTPTFLNLVRLYGGGGVQVFVGLTKENGRRQVRVGGGGQFGFEFFLNHHTSFCLEVGGQGGGPAGGATILAGITLYPF